MRNCKSSIANSQFAICGVAAVVLLALLMGAVILFRMDRAPSAQTLLDRGQRAFDRGDIAQAARLAKAALQTDVRSSAAHLLAANAAAASGQFRDAIRQCEQIRADESSVSIRADCLCGDILLRHRYLISPAEARLRRVLAREPENQFAIERMAYLLTLETRAWELIPFQMLMIRSGSVTPVRVYSLALGARLAPDEALIRQFHKADVEATGPLLALSQLAILKHDYDQAAELLKHAVTNAPDFHAAQARLGFVLLQQEAERDLALWQRSLLPSSNVHPGVWEVRGECAKRDGNVETAARCFWEALRRDPNRPTSNYQLGQCLVTLRREKDAEPFLERALRLERYKLLIDPGETSEFQFHLTVDKCRRAAELCDELALPWEEYGWSVLASQHQQPPPPWAVKRIERIKPQLSALPLVRALPDANPASAIDLSAYALPQTPSLPPRHDAPSQAPPIARGDVTQSQVRFEDRAAEAGIDFTYYNDSDPNVPGMARPFEFTGGGVGVLDYDADGWPDVYFSQGTVFPTQPGQMTYLDRLFRNRGHGRFEDVTRNAGLTEALYGQGVAIGDFNNDGFPDIFVANVGPNHLLVNNGDGTFSKVAESPGADRHDWSTSALIADLNGDGMPEIYTVNYLTAADVFTRICRDAHGPRAPCSPRDFAGAQDRLYWNRGDGHFEDVTASSGVEVPEGKGLGIVAADFHGRGQLNLFIANDGVANFLFENVTRTSQESPRFQECALRCGVAYNEAGAGEGCMGVVVEDLTGDARLDVFVTNFLEESNTLYVQHPGLLFSDATRAADLSGPSVSKVGFGTQAVDGELDGLPDLLVTNGHVDDYTQQGLPYHMPPQYFSNDGNGRFVEVSAQQLGTYFQGQYLGRGMARLDWNRDGLEDVVISHLDSPAALLTNTTPTHGHFLALRLVGTASSRDAIGATATIKTEQRRWTRQLTAGDGYLCSNQRQLVFGLGNTSGRVTLEVRWPSGRRQTFDNLPIDRQLIVIEGQPTPLLLNGR